MQRVSGGYTIIEVMIFLAVSGFLLIVSMSFLSGRVVQTRFSQSMRDAQSKMQDWINDVPTGFPGGTSGKTDLSGLRCTVSSGHAQIDNSGVGTNDPDCIFLGKAIQFTDSSSPPTNGQESKVYAYSVFGSRTTTDASGNQQLVSNLEEAQPVPAVGIGSVSGTTDLTDTYALEGGAKVLSVTSKAVDSTGAIVNGTNHLAGFFLSFNQLSANRNGSQDLKSYIYNLPNNEKPGNIDNTVDACISLQAGCAKTPVSLPDDSWPQGLQEWDICFGNNGNSDTAILTISSSGGLGASTNLQFKVCT